MNSIGYNQTDRKIKINIYGLEFEIKNLSNEKIKEIKEDKDDLNEIINDILGEGSVDKINEQRKNDGYPEMDLNVQSTILGFILQTYTQVMTNNVIKGTTETFNRTNKRINNYNRYRR